MDLNDPNSSAATALKYLCQVGNADPRAWFTIVSLSSDLGLSEQEGRSVFSFLVSKRLARYIGLERDTIIPTDAGLQFMGYSMERRRRR